MVAVKVALLLVVIAIGAFYVKPENYHPFAPNGWRGIQAGAAIIFFAFIGFDAVSTTAEECKDPARDMPRGIIGSLVICTVIYVGVCAVVAGILPYSAYHGVADPIAHAFSGTSAWVRLWPCTALAPVPWPSATTDTTAEHSTTSLPPSTRTSCALMSLSPQPENG